MANDLEDRWVSVEQIAEYLGVVRDSIYRWIENRGLPAHKVGKLWKFKKTEVDEWVRQGGGEHDRQEKRERAE